MELGNETFPCRVIVADIDQDGILGTNFLEHYKCVIDIAKGLLQLPHGKLYMAKGNKPKACRVLTSHDVEIPARAQLVLNCRVSGHCKMTSTVSVVEPLQRAVTRHGILVGRCLVNTGPQVPVLLLNPGPTPVPVAARSSVALLKPISYLDDLSVDEIFPDSVGLESTPVETAAQSHPYVGNCLPVPPGTGEGNVHVACLHSNTVPGSNRTGSGTPDSVDGSLSPVHPYLDH